MNFSEDLISKLNNFKCPICNSSNLRFTLEEGKFPSKESSTGFFTFYSRRGPLHCNTCGAIYAIVEDEEGKVVDLKIIESPFSKDVEIAAY